MDVKILFGRYFYLMDNVIVYFKYFKYFYLVDNVIIYFRY